MTAPVPSRGDTEARRRIERVLDFPTSFDAATFAEWKRQMADAVLDALGLEQVGWGGDHGEIVSDDEHSTGDRLNPYAPCDYWENGECWTCGCCADPDCCDDNERCLGSRRRCGAVIAVQGGEPVFCGAIEAVHGDALGMVTGHDFDAVLS